jgi:multidrug resistance efflux pump
MRSKLILNTILLLLVGSLAAACGSISPSSANQAEPTQIPVVIADTQVVSEGRLVPRQHVNLSFKIGGQVAEVMVEEGNSIESGQVIARLADSEQLEVAVANAELELLNAQQARKELVKNTDVNTALALQAITDARDAVRDAERYQNNLQAGSRQTDIDSARADVIILEENLDKAKEKYKPYTNKTNDNIKKATLLSKMADAQAKYDNAVRLLNNLQGSASELDTAIADASLAVAQAQLALAEQTYEDLNDGPDPDDLAAVESRITAAETGLTAARAALENLELIAPFSGTVVDLQLKVGEQVSAGMPVVLLADISEWMVETDDLTEIEVPEIRVGQSVAVTPDALPELELSGTVESISELFEEKRGDITYTVRIRLNEEDERLRWGMTVVITFVE